jgi:uncharacterized membrane protein
MSVSLRKQVSKISKKDFPTCCHRGCFRRGDGDCGAHASAGNPDFGGGRDGSDPRARGGQVEIVTTWTAILIASAIVLATKLAGYLVPASVAAHPRIQRVSDLLTVALLASLVVTQTVATGETIGLDARFAAALVAAGMLRFRAPFILVVVGAAAVAGILRLLGWAV